MKIFAFTLIFLTLAGSVFAGETFNAVNLSAQDAEVSQSVSSLHEKSFVVNEVKVLVLFMKNPLSSTKNSKTLTA